MTSLASMRAQLRRLIGRVAQHARKHFHTAGHPIIQSFEPGEGWFWNFQTEIEVEGSRLAPPEAHPMSQPTPGPRGRVPVDWEQKLHG